MTCDDCDERPAAFIAHLRTIRAARGVLPKSVTDLTEWNLLPDYVCSACARNYKPGELAPIGNTAAGGDVLEREANEAAGDDGSFR